MRSYGTSWKKCFKFIVAGLIGGPSMIRTLSIGDIIDRANQFPAAGLLEGSDWQTDMNRPLTLQLKQFR